MCGACDNESQGEIDRVDDIVRNGVAFYADGTKVTGREPLPEHNDGLVGHRVSQRDYSEFAVKQMLLAIGENPQREGLLETPARVAKAWDTWFSGYNVDPKKLLAKDFADGAEGTDEMVLLRHIPVMSHCEHHITPFIGVAHVAYIPSGKIVGISKLARVVDAFARRLQVQERLTTQIADCIEEVLEPMGVGVVITAKHFCMATRGVMTPGVDTTTSALRGAMKNEAECRAEFFKLISLP